MTTLAGARRTITAVGMDVSVSLPSAFLAVTASRTVLSTSGVVST